MYFYNTFSMNFVKNAQAMQRNGKGQHSKTRICGQCQVQGGYKGNGTCRGKQCRTLEAVGSEICSEGSDVEQTSEKGCSKL